MEEGIITRGIAGFYYVRVDGNRIIECKARGRFRKENIIPVVGDRVCISPLDDSHGVIDEIMERKNLLQRPVVANVDQAIVVFALKKPDIDYTLLDKLLIMIEHYGVEAVICFNKGDLDNEGLFKKIKNIFEGIGYKVIRTNGITGEGVSELKHILKGKVSVFSGPSGVGKSTISNFLQGNILMQTGAISEKAGRGKHTTRHAEIIEVDTDTFIVDTPGFSSIDLSFMKPEELQYAFKEFDEFLGGCKFQTCMHFKEAGCSIKQQVAEGKIHKERYNAYTEILQEMQKVRRNK